MENKIQKREIMCPEVYASKAQPTRRVNQYLSPVPVEKVEIDGDIITDRSRFNPNAPFHSNIQVWVRDEVEAEKLRPFIGGQIVKIKADERGNFNGRPDLVSPIDQRFIDTLTDVNTFP